MSIPESGENFVLRIPTALRPLPDHESSLSSFRVQCRLFCMVPVMTDERLLLLSQIPRKLMLQGSSGDVGTDSPKSSLQTVCFPTGRDTFALFPDPISPSWHEDSLFGKVNINLVTHTLKLAFSPNIKYFSLWWSAIWNWSVWLFDQCCLSHQPINPTKQSDLLWSHSIVLCAQSIANPRHPANQQWFCIRDL